GIVAFGQPLQDQLPIVIGADKVGVCSQEQIDLIIRHLQAFVDLHLVQCCSDICDRCAELGFNQYLDSLGLGCRILQGICNLDALVGGQLVFLVGTQRRLRIGVNQVAKFLGTLRLVYSHARSLVGVCEFFDQLFGGVGFKALRRTNWRAILIYGLV